MGYSYETQRIYRFIKFKQFEKEWDAVDYVPIFVRLDCIISIKPQDKSGITIKLTNGDVINAIDKFDDVVDFIQNSKAIS